MPVAQPHLQTGTSRTGWRVTFTPMTNSFSRSVANNQYRIDFGTANRSKKLQPSLVA
ncbi:hypothetical protein [Gimesia maris]|uniref:hypothetical protein n=1 Tax=Gimesia maris TaxID=122 RepID=UPI0018D7BE16|nr:hypothetical protein [Gimesia maris]